LTPHPFRLVSDETCELGLGTFSWIVSQLDCKWKLECFSCPWPWKIQENLENWRNSCWWSANRGTIREND